ncbi:MAG: hypothetical protein WAT12_08440 [Candidatus Nitrotoga sp.]
MNWVGGVTKPEAAQQLMRQGGIPNIGLTSGGQIKFIKLEHVWVEAFVDYVPSRGAVNKKPNTWVPMDASYKQHTYTQAWTSKAKSCWMHKPSSPRPRPLPPLNPQAGYKTSTVLRAGQNGWRHQGSKPHGRDSRYEAWHNAREPDGDNAGTLEIGQQDSLHSKYRCFVEYRYGQIKMANRH